MLFASRSAATSSRSRSAAAARASSSSVWHSACEYRARAAAAASMARRSDGLTGRPGCVVRRASRASLSAVSGGLAGSGIQVLDPLHDAPLEVTAHFERLIQQVGQELPEVVLIAFER